MALELEICVIQNGCDGFYVSEKTGAYDALLNPTGWGAPNATIGSATAATLSVLYAGATVAIDIDVLPSLPTTNVDAAYNVTVAALGLTEMPAGLTRVTYTVIAGGTTYTTTKNVLFDCEVACCVSNKLVEASSAVVNGDCCNECKDEKVINSLYLEAVLEGARAATCGGLTSIANSNISYLETKCGDSACSGC